MKITIQYEPQKRWINIDPVGPLLCMTEYMDDLRREIQCVSEILPRIFDYTNVDMSHISFSDVDDWLLECRFPQIGHSSLGPVKYSAYICSIPRNVAQLKYWIDCTTTHPNNCRRLFADRESAEKWIESIVEGQAKNMKSLEPVSN